ncbi:MAG: c-type cytochrome domain-containing protein, partial [Isosphaeraceae bacterium]
MARLHSLLAILLYLLLPVPLPGQDDKSQAGQGNGATEALDIAERTDREIHFETKVRPVLASECLKCHNEKKASGGLNLSSIMLLKKGGDSGPALKPGDARNSLMIKAIERKTEDIAPMPPKKPLNKEQIADIIRWVSDGAHWPATDPDLQLKAGLKAEEKTHWAFQPLANPSIPPDASGWARTPI